MAAIDNADVIECKNEADDLWKEDANVTFHDNSVIYIKSEVDENQIGYNVNEEGSLKETVENFNNIIIKKERVEIEIELEEVTANADFMECKNEVDPLFEEETNLTAYDDSEINIKSELDETPIDYSINEEANLGVQFAKSPRVELWKCNPPPEYAGVFGSSFKKPKAEPLKQKNKSKTSNNEFVKSVNSDANISGLIKKTEHLENAKDVANCTETVVGDKTNSLAEICKVKFICDECGQQFHKKGNIIRHMKTKHVKDIDIRFQKYAYSSVTKDRLKKHSKLNCEKRKYFCDKCNNRFISKHNLKRHKQRCGIKSNVSNTHSALEPYSCKKCGVKFNLKHDFLIHKRTHTGEKPYSCTVCKKQFSVSSSLNAHMRTHTGEKSYSCTVCKKQFSVSSSLNSHMRTHTGEKPYSCTVCEKQFTLSGNLKYHMRTHTGEKPYSCTVCKKQFSQGSNLERHMRTHTGEKPYVCTVCNKQVSLSHHLDIHMRTHTGEKPYSCTVCKKQFSQSGHLDSHMRTHTGEKRYSCSVCNKQFGWSSKLNIHMRTHTGEKPYSCTVCQKQFCVSSSLNDHMRTHTGEKRYSCTVCKMQFNKSFILNRHMRTHTGEKP